MRVAAAVLLLFVLCALPAQAQTGADVTIVVVPPDGSEQRTLTFSSLGEPDMASGHTLASVLRRAGVFVGTYDSVEVAQPGGAVVAIPRGEIRLTKRVEEPSDRANDPSAPLAKRTWTRTRPRENPVVLRTGAAGVELLRPVEALTGHLEEEVLAPVDGVLTLTAVAEANLVASPGTALPGDTVRFVATPPRGTVYEGVEYAWDFGDDTTTTTAERETTHVYEAEATRNVTVRFLRDGAEVGSATDIVYVDDPSADRGAGDISGDGRDGRRRRARESRRGEQGSGDGSGDGTGDGSGDGLSTGGWEDSGSGGYVAPPPVDAYEPAPVTPVEAEPQPKPEPEPRPRRAEQPAPAPEPAGETVDGYLLASAGGPGGGADAASQLPEDAPPELQELARTPTEAAAGGRQLPTIVWVVAGLLALIVLGWALEGRRTLPYWQP